MIELNVSVSPEYVSIDIIIPITPTVAPILRLDSVPLLAASINFFDTELQFFSHGCKT